MGSIYFFYFIGSNDTSYNGNIFQEFRSTGSRYNYSFHIYSIFFQYKINFTCFTDRHFMSLRDIPHV